MYRADEVARIMYEETLAALAACGDDRAACAREVVLRISTRLHGPWELYLPAPETVKKVLGMETRDDAIRRAYHTSGLALDDLAQRYGLSHRHLRRILFKGD